MFPSFFNSVQTTSQTTVMYCLNQIFSVYELCTQTLTIRLQNRAISTMGKCIQVKKHQHKRIKFTVTHFQNKTTIFQVRAGKHKEIKRKNFAQILQMKHEVQAEVSTTNLFTKFPTNMTKSFHAVETHRIQSSVS